MKTKERMDGRLTGKEVDYREAPDLKKITKPLQPLTVPLYPGLSPLITLANDENAHYVRVIKSNLLSKE